ncbi:hypothetical protein D3C87_1731270 [compost metagenome]
MGTPSDSSHSARGPAKAASPTIPFRTPIDVMPIWMVERKRVGSSPSFTAAAAPLSPSSISFCSRALRAVTSAISDMANRPLRRMRAKSMAISMMDFLCFG